MRANVSGLFSFGAVPALRRSAANSPIALLNNCYLKIVIFGANIFLLNLEGSTNAVLRRGVGEGLTVAGKVSVKALKARANTVRAAPDAPSEEAIYRNEILEELSAAAREALRSPEEPEVR
jgi:carbon storage regulator CsrA